MGHRARSFSVTTCQSRLVLSLCGVLHANCREIPWQLVHWPENQNVCNVVIVSNLNAPERKGGRLLLRGKTVIARKRKKDLTYKKDFFERKLKLATTQCDYGTQRGLVVLSGALGLPPLSAGDTSLHSLSTEYRIIPEQWADRCKRSWNVCESVCTTRIIRGNV